MQNVLFGPITNNLMVNAVLWCSKFCFMASFIHGHHKSHYRFILKVLKRDLTIQYLGAVLQTRMIYLRKDMIIDDG